MLCAISEAMSKPCLAFGFSLRMVEMTPTIAISHIFSDDSFITTLSKLCMVKLLGVTQPQTLEIAYTCHYIKQKLNAVSARLLVIDKFVIDARRIKVRSTQRCH